MRIRDLFRGLRGSMGGAGVLGGEGWHLVDPLGPSGWFDESSEDSGGYMPVYKWFRFHGRTS